MLNKIIQWSIKNRLIVLVVAGVILLTTLMHLARGIGRAHARVAKLMLVPAADHA